MKLRKLPRALLVAAAALAAAGALALAETVYVKVTSARLIDKPDDVDGKVLKYLKHGEKLERLEHGEVWDKVRRAGKPGEASVEGYVRSRNLSTQEPAGDQPSKFWKLFAAGTDKPEGGATMGAEGLGPAGAEYTRRNNAEAGRKIVEQQMDTMQFDAKALDKFMREGQLGDYAPAKRGEQGR
jgi:hypothetical protein